MFSELGKIDYKDPAICVSTFLSVILMPLTYSITIGLSVGFISYFIIKLALRKYQDLNLGVITLTIVSLFAFIASSSPNLLKFILGE